MPISIAGGADNFLRLPWAALFLLLAAVYLVWRRGRATFAAPSWKLMLLLAAILSLLLLNFISLSFSYQGTMIFLYPASVLAFVYSLYALWRLPRPERRLGLLVSAATAGLFLFFVGLNVEFSGAGAAVSRFFPLSVLVGAYLAVIALEWREIVILGGLSVGILAICDGIFKAALYGQVLLGQEMLLNQMALTTFWAGAVFFWRSRRSVKRQQMRLP